MTTLGRIAVDSITKGNDGMKSMIFGSRSIKNQNRKIGRNEPCTCGSKLKYKHCHGK